MMIDPENWQEELEEFPFRFDKATLKFLEDLNKEIWFWQCETIGPNASDEELNNTKFYIPLMKEWFMWNFYLIINEVHQYLFKKPIFILAEDIITDKEMSGFIEWLNLIKKVKKNMNRFCEKYLEIIND